MADRIRIRLLVLDDATTVSDLNIQGYGLHQLKGQRKGEWSVRVSGNWRIVFRMDTPGEVTVVDLEDYH
jgi:proteic killer suppression protein